MMAFRKGDIVTVKCKVKYDLTETELKDKQLHLDPLEGLGDLIVSPDQVHVHAYNLKHDDRVQLTDNTTAKVLATMDGYAWLIKENGQHSTIIISDLVRLPEVNPDGGK